MKKLSSLVTTAVLTASLLSTPAAVMALSVTTTTTTATDQTTTATAGMTPVEVTTEVKVDYELPYPGMLPDSPLYFLKQMRDWILDKLIMDPVKKAEFYILQADKRVAMGVLLAANGKGTLGEQVISKAEKYMNNAVQALLGLKAQGGNVPAYIVDRLTKALTKHVEVLTAEIAKAGENEKAGLTASLTLVKELQAELAKLK